MDELRFDGRTVVVTGAARGIGRAHALLLGQRGAQVVVADHGGELDGSGTAHGPADDVAREIVDAGGKAVGVTASVADEAGAARIVDAALTEFGGLDAVVNNAGIHDPGLFGDLTVAQFRTMLDVHFLGTLFVTRAAWKHFAARGYGRVVNTVSDAMFGGITELSSYGSAKGAVFGLSRNLATEGVALGIAVNMICPRAYTRMSASANERIAEMFSLGPEEMAAMTASMPPELCAPAAAYLAHESCSITGEILQIGMGTVARVALVVSPGISPEQVTPEGIAAHLDDVMDLSEPTVIETTPLG